MRNEVFFSDTKSHLSYQGKAMDACLEVAVIVIPLIQKTILPTWTILNAKILLCKRGSDVDPATASDRQWKRPWTLDRKSAAFLQ